MKVALASAVGSAITVLGFLLTVMTGAGWIRWLVLLPWALLAAMIPHPNLGTAGRPIYEGTPLDEVAGVVGLLMSALLNIVLVYIVLCKRRQSRDSRSR